jgi:predicted ATPase
MRRRHSRQLKDEERRVLALMHLAGLLNGMGGSLESCGLRLTRKERRLLRDLDAEKECKEDSRSISARLSVNISSFNHSQGLFFQRIKNALGGNQGKIFYLDGPGGTGKTYLLNSIIDLASTLQTIPILPQEKMAI